MLTWSMFLVVLTRSGKTVDTGGKHNVEQHDSEMRERFFVDWCSSFVLVHRCSSSTAYTSSLGSSDILLITAPCFFASCIADALEQTINSVAVSGWKLSIVDLKILGRKIDWLPTFSPIRFV